MIAKKAKQPDAPQNPFDVDRMAKDWGDIMRLSGDLAQNFIKKNEGNSGWPSVDPFNLQGSWLAMIDQMVQHPAQVQQAQLGFWKNYMALWDSALTRMTGGEATDIVPLDPTDRRFKNEAWHQDALFGFIRQSYMLSAKYLTQIVEENSSTLDAGAAHKLKFFTKAFVDALSPTNFAFTNPDVIQTTIEQGGENLVRGMRNLLEDMKRGRMRMTDESKFALGENLAMTPGQVVYRNKMMELIQYAPAGEHVFQTPLLIIPPWINKYYILDMRPDNSFVKWAVEQGHTVFIVSWVNPDAAMKDVQFEDYMQDGILAGLEVIKKQTGQAQANVIGYCIGGTLLGMTLAWLKANGMEDRVKSATFFTTMFDFADAGDLKLFVDEEQLSALHDRMAKQGFLDAESLKSTFNLLRANDLIWSFVINNYLMGREPFPFDLLYWNSDSTNLPAKMHEFYLRHMYLKNELTRPCAMEFGGIDMDLGTVETPAYFLSTREDHIAPWKATYASSKLLGGPVTFTLAGSGHIAGIVNAPMANKYCYWTSSQPGSAGAWLEKARQEPGSWWPHWQKWIEQYGGMKVAALDPAKGVMKALCPAPGEYVKKKP